LTKTETIKDRAVYLYLPSIELSQEWKKRAKKQGTSLSKFIINIVEDSLKRDEDSSYKPRKELWKELERLKQETIDLHREKRILEHVVEKLEAENRRLRAQPFLEDKYEGIRSFQKELIEILRKGGVLSSEEILRKLDVTISEHESVKSISKQLDILSEYGIVKATPRGWMWIK
jgi:predicted HicB family RNase H-like nuclease